MRPSVDQVMMRVAHVLSDRSTCPRRRVGCVLINEHNHIIGSGYNGKAAGLAHCIDVPCGGQTYESGQGLEVCEAIHAEQNALMQCHDVMKIDTAYVTTPPCLHCVKMLLNTGANRIIFDGAHPHQEASRELWERGRRIWRHI